MSYVFFEWFNEWQFWVAMATIFSGFFSIFKYLNDKKAKQQQRDFDSYHKLIERINRSLDSNPISLQVQQAAIFELRNYKRYKTLSIKLLNHWSSDERYIELKDIANDTLEFMKKS